MQLPHKDKRMPEDASWRSIPAKAAQQLRCYLTAGAVQCSEQLLDTLNPITKKKY
jgi:hypothetical protein